MAPACPRCDVAGQEGSFCTSCGYDLRPPGPAVVSPRHRAAAEAPPEIVACRACGARNAKSRQVCGRCRAPLSGDAADAVPPPPRAQGFGPAVRVEPPVPKPSRFLLLVLGLAALVLAGATVTLLVARGIGPFTPEAPEAGPLAALAVERVRASSAQAGEPPQRLLDGDAGTAWAEDGAGPGVGQWVELTLARRARVHRLAIWNGDQRGDRFLARNRVRELRIDTAGERFVVELLDTQGQQVVELPRTVRADRLRLTILSVHGAAPDANTALSELEVYGIPAG
ncbi:MAG TPA: discoidin domain-containing protein [Egibacteraceae bacterium]|nr:discoidin domain-containing protein [Egibacteraceae bacterium]